MTEADPPEMQLAAYMPTHRAKTNHICTMAKAAWIKVASMTAERVAGKSYAACM